MPPSSEKQFVPSKLTDLEHFWAVDFLSKLKYHSGSAVAERPKALLRIDKISENHSLPPPPAWAIFKLKVIAFLLKLISLSLSLFFFSPLSLSISLFQSLSSSLAFSRPFSPQFWQLKISTYFQSTAHFFFFSCPTFPPPLFHPGRTFSHFQPLKRPLKLCLMEN